MLMSVTLYGTSTMESISLTFKIIGNEKLSEVDHPLLSKSDAG